MKWPSYYGSEQTKLLLHGSHTNNEGFHFKENSIGASDFANAHNLEETHTKIYVDQPHLGLNIPRKMTTQ